MKPKILKTLLAADSPEELQHWRDRLPAKEAGLRLETIDSPGAALDRIAGGRMGLLLLALSRTDGPALDLLHRLEARGAAIPVLALASAAHEDAAAAAVEAGAEDYLLAEEISAPLLARAARGAQKCHQLRRELDRRSGELRASEQNFRSMIDSSSEAMIVVDREGQIRFANPAAAAIFDRPLADLEGALFGVPQVAAEGTELNVIRADGTTVLADLRISETRWHGERAWLVSLRDVTASRYSENQLRKLSRAVDQSASIVFITDTHGTIEYVNPKFLQITGYAADEVIGRNPRLLKSGHTSTDEYRELWNTITAGGEWRGELLNRKKNGELYWVSAAMSPIKNKEGETTHFLAIEEDITERKRAQTTLQDERDFINAVLDTVGALVLVMDRQGRIVRFNRACEALTGYRFAEVQNRDFADLFLVPEETAAVSRVFDNLIAGHAPNTYQNYWRTREGDLRLVAWSNTILPGEDGQPAYVIATGIDITEREQVAESLRQSEAHYRGLFVQAGLGMVVLSADGQVQESNSILQRMLGYSGDELRRMTIRDFTHPDDVKTNLLLFKDLIDGQLENYQLEKRYIRKDGRLVWGRLIASAIRGKDGRRQLSIIEDITRRRQAELAEREQRTLAEALRDAAAALNSTLDLDEIFDRLLADVRRVLPLDAADIMLIEDGTARIVRSYGYAERGLSEWVAALRFPVADTPSLRQVSDSGHPLLIHDTQHSPLWISFPETAWIHSHLKIPVRVEDQVIGFLNLESAQPNFFDWSHTGQLQAFADQAAIAIWNAKLYDTVRRHASELEHRVEERTAELEQQRAQLQAILEAMGEGVIYIDSANRARYVNQAFSRLFGYSVPETLNHASAVYHQITGTIENFDDWQQSVRETLEQGDIWRGEVVLRRKDGSTFDAHASVTAVVTADRTFMGRVVVVRDISQEKALQAQRQRFIANASHELRTPLTNVKMRLYLIRKQPHRLAEHLVVVEQVTSRMESLVDDLLDLSRFERGVIELELEEVILQDLINHVVVIQQPHAEQKNIRLTLDFSPDPLPIIGDPKRLTQVFTNLVINAIHYTQEEGEIRIEVTAGEGPEGRFALARIHDSGIGIPPKMLPHIFEPFFRATESTYKGTGLGLTISKEIVELHGGELSVVSEMGVGSTFTVKLALAGPAQDQAESPAGE